MTDEDRGWPPPYIVMYRGIIAALVVLLLLFMLLRFDVIHRTHAAGLSGRYVQLLAVTNEGLLSVAHDITAPECDRILARMREVGLDRYYRELSCLPIDYNQENKRR